MIRFIKAYFKQRAYDKYMQSPEWKKLRALVKKRDEYKCFLCNSKDKLSVHHLYYPKNLFDTKMYMCITLDKKCHEKIHKISKM